MAELFSYNLYLIMAMEKSERRKNQKCVGGANNFGLNCTVLKVHLKVVSKICTVV